MKIIIINCIYNFNEKKILFNKKRIYEIEHYN